MFLSKGFGAIVFACVMAAATGCTKYEYNIVEPVELARHVGGSSATVTIDPIEYRLTTVDNRLVMLIYNLEDAPLQLEGERSSVVDPNGQSHPLRGGPIARGSFAKIVFPPQRPRVGREGPSIGFGVGVGVSSNGYGRRYPYSSAIYDGPQYMDVYDPGDALYWDWEGEGQIRLHIHYDREGTAVTHDFVISRQKM